MKIYSEIILKNNKKIVICKGDITEQDTDAIVNAANSYLKHGGGVAGAIVRKGGEIIQEESDRIGYVEVGDVAVTSAGKLKARYVIHAVGPRWGEGNEFDKLRSAVIRSLEKATELNLETLAMPAISSGIFGFPKKENADLIISTVKEFLENEPTSLKEVRLCNIDRETTEIYHRRALEEKNVVDHTS